MDLSIAVYFLNDETPDTNVAKISRRQLRDKYNVMDQPTNLFFANFGVSKEIFSLFLRKMIKHSAPAYRTTHLRADIKLATFLRFLVTGSYQQTVGNEVHSSTAKSTVCRVISECLTFFQNHICDKWIKMPDPEEENSIIKAFFDSTGFPGIIGCVDGTHIRIKCPGDNVKDLYYNTKGYYSINAMVICDHKTKIMYVDARHPGANHDALVWEQSPVEEQLKENFENGKMNTWILGDSGYKLKPYLMTPFRNPNEPAEKRYNKKHESARNVVERCYGVLKNRFRCIIGSRGLHYHPKKVTQIINVCCALHNICLFYKCPKPEIVISEEKNNEEEDILESEDIQAISIRRCIAINL